MPFESPKKESQEMLNPEQAQESEKHALGHEKRVSKTAALVMSGFLFFTAAACKGKTPETATSDINIKQEEKETVVESEAREVIRILTEELPDQKFKGRAANYAVLKPYFDKHRGSTEELRAAARALERAYQENKDAFKGDPEVRKEILRYINSLKERPDFVEGDKPAGARRGGAYEITRLPDEKDIVAFVKRLSREPDLAAMRDKLLDYFEQYSKTSQEQLEKARETFQRALQNPDAASRIEENPTLERAIKEAMRITQ